MSSEIVYHQACVRVPAEHAGSSEDLYVHLAQAGSSNCYEAGPNGRCGRRARSWQAVAFGTALEVLTWGIRVAGSTEGGMLKMGSASKECTPEQYIRKVRSLIASAAQTDIRRGQFYRGQHLGVSIAWREPKESDADKRVTYYDIRETESVKAFWARYVSEVSDKRAAWNFFEVTGPALR